LKIFQVVVSHPSILPVASCCCSRKATSQPPFPLHHQLSWQQPSWNTLTHTKGKGGALDSENKQKMIEAKKTPIKNE
jgi:hypothetical protein